MTVSVCIHGHFYQPPRENPWTETIDPEPTAAPWPNWNARIDGECYLPNTRARIVEDDKVVERLNNFEHISFNVGPTLLDWLEESAPATYAGIVLADRAAQERTGHGGAIAQAYNHTILPLASRESKVLQVRWGIDSFEDHFDRSPTGMWLPETAVDIETLEVLAEHRIQFVILAPYQAKRSRKIGTQTWKQGPAQGRPHRISLPSGQTINAFFYDGRLSHGLAFGGLLHDGNAAYAHLRAAAQQLAPGSLLHTALDGETFGHHHKSGEMALAAVVRRILDEGEVELTNYSRYLAENPVEWEAEIVPNTAWSCAHGVERWRSDCGCAISPGSGFNQSYRAPLRHIVDTFSERVRAAYLDSGLLKEPQKALERLVISPLAALVETHGAEDPVLAATALESVRLSELAQTSCAWFFDDIASREPEQVLQYVCRGAELCERWAPNQGFDDLLAEARRIQGNTRHGGAQVLGAIEGHRASMSELVALVLLAQAGVRGVTRPAAIRVLASTLHQRVQRSRRTWWGELVVRHQRTLRDGTYKVVGVIPRHGRPVAVAWQGDPDVQTVAMELPQDAKWALKQLGPVVP